MSANYIEERLPFVPKEPKTIDQRFATFHGDYPQVYRLMVGFARQARKRGYEHYGIAAITERARWEVHMTWGPDWEGFKLNNDFKSRYARLIMDTEPDLAGFFRVRRLRTR
jgi:hypothetical protein